MIRKKRPEQLKTKLIQIKVTPSDKTIIENYAIKHGFTLTGLIEEALKEYMKKHK